MNQSQLNQKAWVWTFAALSGILAYQLRSFLDVVLDVLANIQSSSMTPKQFWILVITIVILVLSLGVSWYWFIRQKPLTLRYRFDPKRGFYFAGKDNLPICTRCLIERDHVVHIRDDGDAGYKCTACDTEYKKHV